MVIARAQLFLFSEGLTMANRLELACLLVLPICRCGVWEKCVLQNNVIKPSRVPRHTLVVLSFSFSFVFCVCFFASLGSPDEPRHISMDSTNAKIVALAMLWVASDWATSSFHYGFVQCTPVSSQQVPSIASLLHSLGDVT